MSSRADWLIRTGWLPLAWLLAAAFTSVGGVLFGLFGVDGWLPVHLALLGAVSNAVLVWSAHFTNAVLRTRDDGRRGQVVRLIAFNAGAVLVVLGDVIDAAPVLRVGALLVMLAVFAHVIWLVRSLRGSLPARFARTVHFYIVAACMLIVGIALGVILQSSAQDDMAASRILVAHLTVNLFGWVSLTVFGTLVTLWPTMLRTPMGDGAERTPFATLPWLAIALAASAGGVLLDAPLMAALALIGYFLIVVLTSRSFIRQARVKRPRDLASLSVLAGVGWWAIGLVVLATAELRDSGWSAVADVVNRFVLACLVLGFAVQVVLGALTYLVPVMLGGGPSAVRTSIARVASGGRTRLIALNVATAVVAFGQGWVHSTGVLLAGLAVLSWIGILAASVVLAVRSKATPPDAPDASNRLGP